MGCMALSWVAPFGRPAKLTGHLWLSIGRVGPTATAVIYPPTSTPAACSAGCRRGPGGSRLAAGDCLAHCNRSLERPGLPWYQHRLESTNSIRPPLAIVAGRRLAFGGTCARADQQQRNCNGQTGPGYASRASAATISPSIYRAGDYHLRATATTSPHHRDLRADAADIPAAGAAGAACVGDHEQGGR